MYTLIQKRQTMNQSTSDVSNKMKDISNTLFAAQNAYYLESEPIMTDAKYDAWFFEQRR